MKRRIGILSTLVLLMLLSACNAATPAPSTAPVPSAGISVSDNPVIRLSTTTSVNDSGLLPYLQPYFEADTGYQLEITSAGTGAAIEKGRTGDADCLLVHAKASEEAFIGEGYATERVPFLYNFFVIVGPADDPAGIASAANATQAFQAIAASGSPFISRGDESGTHKAETKIWEAAGLAPDPAVDTWYISAGQGMGACLNLASQQQAYCLTDKGTYLAHEQRDTLKLLLEESDELKNTYSMLAISPEKWPDTNFDGANTFIAWMQSEKAVELIRSYGVEEYGEPLFFLLNQ
ncbi:MAG: solute-binding protein [Oscillospiraceae bacterium]|nr:solute-binding protein [Oscillospiraceae bacterium]